MGWAGGPRPGRSGCTCGPPPPAAARVPRPPQPARQGRGAGGALPAPRPRPPPRPHLPRPSHLESRQPCGRCHLAARGCHCGFTGGTTRPGASASGQPLPTVSPPGPSSVAPLGLSALASCLLGSPVPSASSGRPPERRDLPLLMPRPGHSPGDVLGALRLLPLLKCPLLGEALLPRC